MDTLESKVCELMGSGNATVNTDVSTLGKKKTHGSGTGVGVLHVCKLHSITL